MRFNGGKPKLSYVDQDSFMDTADVLDFGSQKYARDNWRKGLPVTEIIDSLERHIAGLKRGEFLDPESGLPHHGHIGCNVMFLSHVMRQHPEFINLMDIQEKAAKYYLEREHIPHSHGGLE